MHNDRIKIILAFLVSIAGTAGLFTGLSSSFGLVERLADLVAGEYCPAGDCLAPYGRATVIILLAAYALGLLLAWKVSRSLFRQRGSPAGLLFGASIGAIPTLALLITPVFAATIYGGSLGALLFLIFPLIFGLSAALGFTARS